MALPNDYAGQACSLARSLEIIGERWTLLIVRDAFWGVRRFADFIDHLRMPLAVRSTAGHEATVCWSARLSWLREVMPSLVKILCRWYSTVRGLMNSWAAISELDWPSVARRTICVSWGVSWTAGEAARLRSRSPVAASSRPARAAKASAPIEVKMSRAARSCSRASIRRPWRRSHSPYRAWPGRRT